MDDDEHKAFGKTWLDSSETKIINLYNSIKYFIFN